MLKDIAQSDTVTTAQLPKFNQTPTITSPNGMVIGVPVDVNISDNNAPSPSLKESFTDQGLNGYGSSYNFSSGGGSVSYSLSQDGSVKMVSADVGKVVGGSKKLIGLDIAATGMKILDI